MTMRVTATVTTVLDHVVDMLHRAGAYNKNDQIAPAVVLWTDEARLWEPVMPDVRRRLDVLTVGDYSPEDRTGPAIWIRCALAGQVPEIELDPEVPPVIYLPGYGRHHLRAVEECPAALQPLAELQYRGTWFTQASGRDWTPRALLVNHDYGLGLQVADDAPTVDALRAVIGSLVDQSISYLQTLAPIGAADLLGLVEGDVHGAVLRWMDHPDEMRALHDDWSTFCELCRQRLHLDPEADTPISAAEKLAERRGEWAQVWKRFCDAPTNYPGVPPLLRSVPRVLQLGLEPSEVWPQDNDEQEELLRAALGGLDGRTADQIRAELAVLEQTHALRRSWVWAKIGETPLANALGHLVELADLSAVPANGATIAQTVEHYAAVGWTCDAALVRALAAVERNDDLSAVQAAARGLYRPWAEAGANHLRTLLGAEGVPPKPAGRSVQAGACWVFTDGLRYDVGQWLADELRRRQLEVEVEAELAAVPTVTGTAKPAASPVAGLLSAGAGLGTRVTATGTALTAEVLRRLLADEGVQVLAGDETGDPSGRGWTELGDLDQLGHGQGAKLPRYVDAEVRQIADRVAGLLRAGWRRVEVFTDHGWLLVPGGLDKVDPDLKAACAEVRKGRCARVKDDAVVEMPTLPWSWDPSVRIAVAPGLMAFEKGKVYEHGGVSPQESIVPRLVVTSGTPAAGPVDIESKWVALRCRVEVHGAPPGAVVDIRTKPADPATSLATRIEELDAGGAGSLLARDDELQGNAAVIVVLDANGTVLAQRPTIVGGSR